MHLCDFYVLLRNVPHVYHQVVCACLTRFCHREMPQSYYRRYVPWLEVLLGGGTASKDTPYLPTFGVFITLKAVQFVVIGVGPNSPVQLKCGVRMRSSDTVAKRPFTSIHLMSP